jgi:hypothetical protein
MFGFDIKHALVLTPDYEVVEFNQLPREEYPEVDHITNIRALHQNLWAFYVFCGDRAAETLQKVKVLCNQIFSSRKALKDFLDQFDSVPTTTEDGRKTTKVFISYSHADSVEASSIEDALRHNKLDIFRDKTNLRAGHRWPKEIEKFLQTCDALLLLWSRNSADSEWVEKERTFSMLEKKKIIIVRLDETPIAPFLVNVQAIIHTELSVTTREILRGLGIEGIAE